MKILQAMAGAEYGGAEEFFVRLAIALNGLDIQQRVVIRENEMWARRLYFERATLARQSH